MPSVLIVYASDYGNTKAMAEAITEGVTSVAGVTATLKTAAMASPHESLRLNAKRGLLVAVLAVAFIRERPLRTTNHDHIPSNQEHTP